MATQGRNVYAQWMTEYKLQYSNDGVNFKHYRQHGQNADKVKDVLFVIYFLFLFISANTLNQLKMRSVSKTEWQPRRNYSFKLQL